MIPWARFPRKNLWWQTHYTLLVAFFCPFLVWNTDQTQYQGNCQQRQHLGYILYTQRWGFGWRLKNNKILCQGKKNINPNPPKHPWMHNNGDAKSLQYIFEWEPTKVTTKDYPYLGLSGQKTYAAQSQKKYFLLVDTDIGFIVTN